MADWCDLTLGNPLDEQPDFDGDRRRRRLPRSLRSHRKHRGFVATGQWTSSGLPVDLPFWWWVRGEFSVANGQVLKIEPRKAPRRLHRGDPVSPIQILMLE
ncbi:hypothetical protein E4U57_006820 [Claviceps arundinis]|uniref:Uncharacterized protein n=1 Tax=Claviceps arundinis TaxID=1623583 RepID=A0ABQ7P1I8_9HYPO|nr:hypothetical protein E4U57_006820 [Claviceps arundinis]